MIWDKYWLLTIKSEWEVFYTKAKRKCLLVKCLCECWKETMKRFDLIKSWEVKSCWCLKWKINIQHWMCWTKIYNAWQWMKNRCKNSNINKDKTYISVTYDSRWESFENFYNDMAPSYFEWAELDKDILCNKLNINPKRYWPDTCIWVTKQMNSKNRSSSVFIEYRWRKQIISEWAKELNISSKLLYKRINDYWWSIEKAFTQKIKNKVKYITYNWETESVKYFANKFWIKYRTLSDRLYKWMNVDEALKIKNT